MGVEDFLNGRRCHRYKEINMNLNSGYAIIRKMKIEHEEYFKHFVDHVDTEYLSKLRECFSFLNPISYRGFARLMFQSYPSLDKKLIDIYKKGGLDMDSNASARRRFCEFTEEKRKSSYDLNFDEDYLLDKAEQALEVFSLLDKKDNYEIIHIQKEVYTQTPQILGYDIGVWLGDLSLICDCVVIPRWHPPDLSDFEDVIIHFKKLNNYLLFDNIEDAKNFRSFYKSRSWAETEDYEGQFSIIQIDEVKISGR